MKKYIAILACAFSIFSMNAQSKKSQDIEAIKKMCGCYEVIFKYTETFAPEIDYEKKLDYSATALEWAKLIEEEDGKLSIQHLLIVNDDMVIKHWRQDWVYENQKVFAYKKDNTWTFNKLKEEEVKGQWTQKVYQVDDSPRYSGSATWVHFDGKNYWENDVDAPLPRREYSKRDDYNVMKRGNRQEISTDGWVHEQDNDKIIREANMEDVLLAQEKGYNIYRKIDDSKCKVAEDWWEENQKLWKKVRSVWDEVYDRQGDLTFSTMVDGKPMYKHFYTLSNKSTKKEIRAIIDSFVNMN